MPFSNVLKITIILVIYKSFLFAKYNYLFVYYILFILICYSGFTLVLIFRYAIFYSSVVIYAHAYNFMHSVIFIGDFLIMRSDSNIKLYFHLVIFID